MTDEELLAKADAQMPRRQKVQGRIVRRAASSSAVNPDELANIPQEDPLLLAGLESLLGMKLPPPPASDACVDVAYDFDRGDGQRATTVVQIRGGEVVRKIRRG